MRLFSISIFITVPILSTVSYRLLHTFRPNSYSSMKPITSFFQTKSKGSETNERKHLKESNSAEGSTEDVSEENPRAKKAKTTESANSELESNTATTTISSSIASNDINSVTKYLDENWKNRLQSEFSKSYFKELERFVANERKNNTVFPPEEETFTAMNLCPFDKVKVVIIGQDPYHGVGQAHGLAFSVRKGVPPPPSLKNMFIELQDTMKIPKPTHGNLEHWSKQGVLLLNTCLTVRKAEANSHQKKGWETFTDAIVRELSKKEHLVYLLWGLPASNKCQSIDRKKNVIISTSHPSPLGAYKTDHPFMRSNCFAKCNEALVTYGEEPIDWTVK